MNPHPYSSPKIEDWFTNGIDFERTLAKAVEKSHDNPKHLDFLADIKHQWDNRGMAAYMSRKVYAFLCNLAEVDECPC